MNHLACKPSGLGGGLKTASVKDYQMPVPNADLNRKPLLADRHLIILNNSSRSAPLRLRCSKHTVGVLDSLFQLLIKVLKIPK